MLLTSSGGNAWLLTANQQQSLLHYTGRALWPPDRGELLQLTQAALLDMGQLSSQDSMF